MPEYFQMTRELPYFNWKMFFNEVFADIKTKVYTRQFNECAKIVRTSHFSMIRRRVQTDDRA